MHESPSRTKAPSPAAEMKTILDADSGASPWVSTTSSDPTSLSWSRSDKATVIYDKDKHVLIFTSEAMANAYHSLPPQTPPSTPGNETRR